MPKLKTHKATADRFIVKRKKKAGKKTIMVMKRTDGQDHFNARQTGKKKRNKRSDMTISKTNHKSILFALPYAQ